MIELKGLDIGYASKKGINKVFSGIDLSFSKGELIGMIGNNGVGKSTLIKTIFGTLKPLKGEVLIDQKNISEFDLYQLATKISIVLTDKIGGFNLTVYDVVASGRIPYLNAFGQLKEGDARIVERSLEQIGISALKQKPMDELSDGQRQKVMIAKSLAQQTPLILLDEPTAFLDYSAKQQLFVILKQLCKEQQKTVIVSSHDLDILFKNTDRILYLKDDSKFEFSEPGLIQRQFAH
jgi:iron complex transport system ATP-binding protein